MLNSPMLPDEQPQSLDDIASRSMTGYQAIQDLWRRPPQPLPGPDDHPFFKMFAPDAYSTLLQPSGTHVSPHASAATETTPSESPVFEMPLVYPFVPRPSLSMEPMTPEPMTPEPDSVTTPLEHSAKSPSQYSTPSLSYSNPDHDSSPESRPTTAEGPWPTKIRDSPEVAKMQTAAPEQQDRTSPVTTTNQEPGTSTPDKLEVDGICILTYMKAIPNSETSEPAVIANGQIWRSPDKKKGWRRNQWILDVR
jgi:hypothetical protein